MGNTVSLMPFKRICQIPGDHEEEYGITFSDDYASFTTILSDPEWPGELSPYEWLRFFISAYQANDHVHDIIAYLAENQRGLMVGYVNFVDWDEVRAVLMENNWELEEDDVIDSSPLP